MAVQWREVALKPAPAVSDERIAEVQDSLGVTFPADYLAVVKAHQGAAPTPNGVRLSDGTGTAFSMLLHFEDEPEGVDLLGVTEGSTVLPDGVIPFAADPGDNYLCFDYRTTETDPPVVFMATDDPDAQPQPLAASFTELIESLESR